MKDPIVIIGIGEIGSVIARGYMRIGHPIFPVTRNTDIEAMAQETPSPLAVIVAVGEKDLDSSLESLPNVWRDKLVLIQNELLPSNWEPYAIENPTIASIWFEKKKGQDSKVVVPSIAYGPHSESLKAALHSLDIPVTTVATDDELLFELVRKNLYILTTNIAGLKAGGTVSSLWRDHQELAQNVVTDVLSIQNHLIGKSLEKQALLDAMLVAFDGDPEHNCMGRSAPARLARALDIAKQNSLNIPTLQKIATSIA